MRQKRETLTWGDYPWKVFAGISAVLLEMALSGDAQD